MKKFRTILFTIYLSVIYTVGVSGQSNIDILTDSIALADYIYTNTHYSLMYYIEGREGSAVYKLETDSLGYTKDLQIISKSDGFVFEAEAKRIIYSIPPMRREKDTTYIIPVNIKLEDNKIYRTVEEEPEFQGGYENLFNFIRQHLKYPLIHSESGIEGKVICGFVIEKDGSINIIEVIRSLDRYCDAEAIQVIKKMPRWKAGKLNGKPVRVYFVLPVTFRLQ